MVIWLFGWSVGWSLGCLFGWLVGWLVGRWVGWLVGWLDDSLEITITGEGLQNVEIKSACIAFEGGTLVFAVSSERNKGRCPIAVSNPPPPFFSQNVLH